MHNDKTQMAQKTALKIILKEKFKSYENALDIIDLPTLEKTPQQNCCRSLPTTTVY